MKRDVPKRILPAVGAALSLLIAVVDAPRVLALNGNVATAGGILIASVDTRAAESKGQGDENLPSDKTEKPAKSEKSEKNEKSVKSEKSDKSAKTEKSEKTDKSEKSEKSTRKTDKDSKESKEDKKKEDGRKKKKESKHGFFGGKGKDGGNAKDAKETEEPQAREPQKEDEKVVFHPDSALISVLKDLSRSVKASEPYDKITDENARMVVGLAQEIIDKALSDPKLGANRIVPSEEGNSKKHLTAESWSSGDIALTEKFHGSLATVWAKRVDGLLTVTVAGDCQDRKSPDGSSIGEFIVIFTARSPIESGFDIQSQGNVNFWIGKLGNITVEADCVKDNVSPGESDDKEKDQKEQKGQKLEKDNKSESELQVNDLKKKRLTLQPLLTNRYRQHFELIARQEEERQKIALKLAEAHEAAKQKQEGSQENPETKASGQDSQGKTQGKTQAKASENPEQIADNSTNKPADTSSQKPAESNGKSAADQGKQSQVQNEKLGETNKVLAAAKGNLVSDSASSAATRKDKETQSGTAPIQEKNRAQTSGLKPEPVAGSEVKEENELPALRQPKNFVLLAPERVLAGQPITVGFLDEDHNPEGNVAIAFNGVGLTTDQNGQAQYSVPEDETPGRSLNISLPARPYELPSVVEVLQPLVTPGQGQPPRLDKATPLLSRHTTLVIDGHNFDGVAGNNRVIIDGMNEAQIVAASPVQLKVLLPKELRAGLHTLCVSTQGMRSNPMGFELALLEIHCEGKNEKESKDNACKLVVKVLGTASRVGVKIINRSPEMVRINHTEEKLTSSGGNENNLTLPLQRIKKGPVKVEAWLEL